MGRCVEAGAMPRAVFSMLAVTLGTLSLPGTAAAQEGPLPPAYCEPSDSRTPVLLIGSYHMANPGLDQFNLEADDVRTERRQMEVERVVARLAEFRPTIVAIEARASSSVVDEYRAYLDGDRELEANEIDQIGFRLAAAAGLARVEPIDFRLPLSDSTLTRAAENDETGAVGRRLGELGAFGQEAMRTLGGWLSEGSVGDMLYRMNTPAALAWANRPYVDHLLLIRDGDEATGAEFVAEWYRRNLVIFSNLFATLEGSGDRVFVVYGQGHIPILRDLVVQHPALCVEDPLPYLERAR